MDPVSAIGLVGSIIGIAGAFRTGYKSFRTWRKKRKAKKSAEQELENSLDIGSLTVETAYDKHHKIHGFVFANGDGI